MRFDLLTEPWLPVIGPDGDRRDVSLTEALTRSEQHTTVLGDSPTQRYALLRLLLAVTAAAGVDRQAAWENRRLPTRELADYLQDRADRFDLLHASTPFLQVADLTTKGGPVSPMALVPDVTGRTYATRAGDGRDTLTHAEAARWLVHCHAFDVLGIRPGAIGDPRVRAGKGYPIGVGASARGAGWWIEGATLAETILLNLTGTPGTPAWDRPAATEQTREDRCPDGVADLYTWQTRRVRLHSDGTHVTGATVCQGDPIDAEPGQDPMLTWRHTQGAWRRRAWSPDRPVWQSLTEAHDPRGIQTQPPAVFGRSLLTPADRVTLHVTGVEFGAQDTTVADEGDDHLRIPAAALDPGHPLAGVLAAADKALHEAEAAFVAYVVNLAEAAGAVNPPGDRARAAVRSALDRVAREWIKGLTAGTDSTSSLRQAIVSAVGDLARAEPVPPMAWAGRMASRKGNAGLAQVRLERRLGTEVFSGRS